MATESQTLSHHLRELEIAKDVHHPRRCQPPIAGHFMIGDLGGGIGQTWVAEKFADDQVVVVMDTDVEAVRYGQEHFTSDHLRFLSISDSVQLPVPDEYFDFWVARVSLPYTRIVPTLKEMARCLKPGGGLWFVLHQYSQVKRHLRESFARRDYIDFLHNTFVIANGAFFHFTGRQMKLHNCVETFQTEPSMKRSLDLAGLDMTSVSRKDGFFVVTATKRAA